MSRRRRKPDRRSFSTRWRHHFAKVNGVRLHYVRHGTGFPLFLLHGWPGFWYEWAAVIPRLAARHTVIAPDLRGFNQSDKLDLPPEQGYGRATVAQDLVGLARQLAFARVGVVAHDIGATVALPLARQHPDLVAKLILFDPPYPGIGRRWREPTHVRETWYQIFHTLPWAEELVGVSRRAIRTYLRHFLTHWSHRKEWVTGAELAKYVEAYARPGALRAGFNYYRARERTRTSEGEIPPAELAVHVPTLVLWGERDPIIPIAWADRLPEYFPKLTFKPVPDCGHFMMREDPDRVVAEVLDFFADLRSAP